MYNGNYYIRNLQCTNVLQVLLSSVLSLAYLRLTLSRSYLISYFSFHGAKEILFVWSFKKVCVFPRVDQKMKMATSTCHLLGKRKWQALLEIVYHRTLLVKSSKMCLC